MANKKTTARHKIVFAEIDTLNDAIVLGKNHHERPVVLEVSPTMYKTILKGPTAFEGDLGSNAYVFGKILPVKEYTNLTWHKGDVAGTGIVDLDLLYKAARDAKLELKPYLQYTYEDIKNIVEDTTDNYKRDPFDPVVLKAIRKKFPWVLFRGGVSDNGADVFIHRNTRGNVDSIIIDNDYFFPGEDEDEGEEAGSVAGEGEGRQTVRPSAQTVVAVAPPKRLPSRADAITKRLQAIQETSYAIATLSRKQSEYLIEIQKLVKEL